MIFNSSTFTSSIRYLGRLDTWSVSYFDVDELRYEIREYNIDLTVYEQFGPGGQGLNSIHFKILNSMTQSLVHVSFSNEEIV